MLEDVNTSVTIELTHVYSRTHQSKYWRRGIKKITLGELLRHWKQSRKLAVSVEGKMTEVELTKEVVE